LLACHGSLPLISPVAIAGLVAEGRWPDPVPLIEPMPKSLIARVTTLVALLLIAAIAVFWAFREAGPPGAGGSGTALIGGSFTLTDQSGQTRSDSDFRGKLMLVYFGFTHCPDVCPLDLAKISQAMGKLGAKADQVVPIFVTVDPARDTPAAMRDFVASFDPHIVALTGEKPAIDQLVKDYRGYYKSDASGTDYNVMHSSLIYLMGRDGRYLTHFGQDASVDDIVAGVTKQL
jgi:protein SCO1/2